MRSTGSDDKSSTSFDSDEYELSGEVCVDEDDDQDSEGYSSCGSEEGEPDYRPADDAALEALMHAAEIGDLDEVDAALSRLTVSCSSLGSDGDTALHLASLFGHEAVVQRLLAAGADANQRDNGGGLAVHDACASGHIRIVERLLEAAPESIHAVDEDGDTLLHNAARGNHIDVVQLLLRKGAVSDLKVINLDGESPLDTTDNREVQQLLCV